MPRKQPAIGVLIPARYGSSRFPGKPLAQLAGKPLIQHVYEAAVKVPHVSDVRVVTDDDRIVRAVEAFDGQVMVIDSPCRTGTDRVAKAAANISCSVVVNLQADEIPLQPSLLSNLIDPFLESDAQIGTLKRKIESQEEFKDTALVKVVTDSRDNALYFSRSPIPHVRDIRPDDSKDVAHYGHLGIYIFRYETLLRFADLPTGVLEDAEKLEQLRALEHGIPIRVWETKHSSLRIDRPEELETVSTQFLEYLQKPSNAQPSVFTT